MNFFRQIIEDFKDFERSWCHSELGHNPDLRRNILRHWFKEINLLEPRPRTILAAEVTTNISKMIERLNQLNNDWSLRRPARLCNPGRIADYIVAKILDDLSYEIMRR